MRTKALTVALLLAAGTMAQAASAITINNTNGSLPFSGFDWAQGGTAFTTGFTGATGNTFTLTYFANATALTFSGFNFVPSGLDTIPNGAPGPTPLTGTAYEYTIVATLNESVESCVPTGGGNTQCTFDVTGGNFDIYYDTTSNANASAGSEGTGFQDGFHIIGGTVNPLVGQTFDTTTGANTTTLTGVVTFTNNTYVNPSLLGTTATTTLQSGAAVTSYVNPGGFNGHPYSFFSGHQTSDVVFQADGNQSFTAAPEPASLALIGLGLGVLGWSVRRKNS